MRVLRGFTLVEVMVVVAIIGILAGLAVAGLSSLSGRSQGRSSAHEVLFALSLGRSLAERNDEPVEVELFSDRLVIRKAVVQFPNDNPGAARATVTGFTPLRAISLPSPLRVDSVQESSAASVARNLSSTTGFAFRFCPSTNAFFRDENGEPVCGFGNLASTSATVFVNTGKDKLRKEKVAIQLIAALGLAQVKKGIVVSP